MATAASQSYEEGKYVSIHATLAGGDFVVNQTIYAAKRFYPRHPRGWRPGNVRTCCGRPCVSIHATLAGGDEGVASSLGIEGVSIHATLAGGDLNNFRKVLYWSVSIHATLAGGDVDSIMQGDNALAFLSTPPSRVATPPDRPQAPQLSVSIHATLAGGDRAMSSTPSLL